MIHKVKPWRHVVAGCSVAAVAGLAGFGVIGAGDEAVLRAEHFDAKQVTVTPEGDDGVRIREVVDIDFGIYERHGYERTIPNDFGEPTDIVASSPDANDDVGESNFGGETRIRIGSRFITYTGQHRYILEYTLPQARLTSGRLNLDIIGTEETFTTDRFEVVLTGFDLTDPTCDTGERGAFGGCELVAQDDGDLVTVIEPLGPGDGITVGGAIGSLTERDFGAIPVEPSENPSGFRPLGLLVVLGGALAAAAVFLVSRWFGSNEVRSGGAADAAYGNLPAPRLGDHIADVPTYRVPDSRLAELATIEFVPPRGVDPWQAAVLLSEDVDDETVSAWFSEMVAREAIVIDGDDDNVLRRGPGHIRLSAVDQGLLDKLFAKKSSITLGKYNKSFTNTWKAIKDEQKRFVSQAGWWTRGAPGASFDLKILGRILMPLLFIVIISAGAILTAGRSLIGTMTSPLSAVFFAVVFVGLIAFLVYRTMLPSRSATGSALTLRAESFRRFLVASEGRHVEWAWDNNLLREYSAWAVALGAADAWSDAVESSNIPHPEIALRGPLLVHSSASSFRSSHTPPSSSGGSSGFSGGGFSGGSGGGGGGGSSGSW